MRLGGSVHISNSYMDRTKVSLKWSIRFNFFFVIRFEIGLKTELWLWSFRLEIVDLLSRLLGGFLPIFLKLFWCFHVMIMKRIIFYLQIEVKVLDF